MKLSKNKVPEPRHLCNQMMRRDQMMAPPRCQQCQRRSTGLPLIQAHRDPAGDPRQTLRCIQRTCESELTREGGLSVD